MAKPLPWFFNAARRTLIALVPLLAKPDDEFARHVLDGPEFELYCRMDPRDRVHACHIARRLLQRVPDAPPQLVRAALLHDVGKTVRPYNPFYRILVHLYTPPHAPPRPLRKGLRGAWQVKEHHDSYGAELIREAGGDPLVARLVENHHSPAGDPGALLLKSLDEET